METTEKERIQTKQKKEKKEKKETSNKPKEKKAKKKKQKNQKKSAELGLAPSLAENSNKAPAHKTELVPKHDLAQISARVNKHKNNNLAKISADSYRKVNLATRLARWDNLATNMERSSLAQTKAKKKILKISKPRQLSNSKKISNIKI